MVIGKTFIYWVTGDIAELCDAFSICDIVAYGGAAEVLVDLGLLQPKV